MGEFLPVDCILCVWIVIGYFILEKTGSIGLLRYEKKNCV